MRRQASLCGYAFRMVSGLALYSIVLMLLLPSAIGYHHFRGGSTSVEILDYSNPDFYKVSRLDRNLVFMGLHPFNWLPFLTDQ